MSKLRKFLFEAFENQKSSLYPKVNDVLAGFIFVAVALVILESVEILRVSYGRLFRVSEILITAIFTLEYITYIYLAKDKKKYIFSLFGVVDLLAILPTYLGFVIPFFAPLESLRVLRILRILRLLRMLRVIKLLRFLRGNVDQRRTIFDKLSINNLEIYLLALFSAVVISGTFISIAERSVENTPFVDIPTGMWWAIVTLTTTGYGDLIPQTIIGRVIAGFTMVTGLALFAVLVSVVGRIVQGLLFGGNIEKESAKP